MKVNPDGSTYISRICHDGEGNIYVLILTDDPGVTVVASFYIYKFDRNLKLIMKQPLAPNPSGSFYLSLSASSSGSVMVYHACQLPESLQEKPFTTIVTVFNPDLTVASEVSYPDFRVIRESFFRNDTVTAIIDSGFHYLQVQMRIVNFDAAFNTIAINTADKGDTVPLPFDHLNARIHICSGTLLMTWSSYEVPHCPPSPQTILYFFNNSNKVIARYPFPGIPGDIAWASERFYNDGDGSFYTGGETSFVRYSLDPVLLKSTW
jgi:hypothetical protein